MQIELQHTHDKETFEKNYKVYVELARDSAMKYGIPLTVDTPYNQPGGMATVFLTNFIRCRTSFRMLFRLSLTMSLLGCDDLRQELTVKVRLPR